MSSGRPRLEPPPPPPVDSPEQVAEVFKRYEGWWLTERFFENVLRGEARRYCRNVARWVHSWSRLPLKTMITVYRCGDIDVRVAVIRLVGVEAPRYVYIEKVEVRRQL